MKPTRTWLVIADGARARILEDDGTGHRLQKVKRHEYMGDHSARHDRVSDRQGRSFNCHAPGQSPIASHSDPHRELQATFANVLADVRERGLTQGSYDHRVIAAPPITLRDLRAAISDYIRAKIIGEIDQDLTRIPNGRIGEHLKEVLMT
jgi:protein required for attachment to host cells